MAIELRPDLEEMVLEDVQRGSCRNVDEYLERAVTMLHTQERWLVAHREEIAARIEAELASDESDLPPAGQAKQTMHEEHRP